MKGYFIFWGDNSSTFPVPAPLTCLLQNTYHAYISSCQRRNDAYVFDEFSKIVVQLKQGKPETHTRQSDRQEKSRSNKPNNCFLQYRAILAASMNAIGIYTCIKSQHTVEGSSSLQRNERWHENVNVFRKPG